MNKNIRTHRTPDIARTRSAQKSSGRRAKRAFSRVFIKNKIIFKDSFSKNLNFTKPGAFFSDEGLHTTITSTIPQSLLLPELNLFTLFAN